MSAEPEQKLPGTLRSGGLVKRRIPTFVRAYRH